MIHVCSLARLHDTVEDTGARHVVSLIGDEARSTGRPRSSENHLWLRLHDISAPLDGYIFPEEAHVADLLDFVRRWDRRAPLRGALLRRHQPLDGERVRERLCA